MPAAASTALRSAVEALGDVPGCRVGLCALGLEGERAGKEVSFAGGTPLPSASVIKVLILAGLLRRADAGLSLSERVPLDGRSLVADSGMVAALEPEARPTLGWLAEAMITTSDNTATNLLIERLGERRINALARDLGMEGTVLARRMMDAEARARGAENLTTARDTTRLLAALYGHLLSSGSRSRALGLLLGQRQPPDLPMNAPAGARLAYKPGDLPDVRNCAALVLLPGRSFALTVLAHGDFETARPAIHAATREINAYLPRGSTLPNRPGGPR